MTELTTEGQEETSSIEMRRLPLPANSVSDRMRDKKVSARHITVFSLLSQGKETLKARINLCR